MGYIFLYIGLYLFVMMIIIMNIDQEMSGCSDLSRRGKWILSLAVIVWPVGVPILVLALIARVWWKWVNRKPSREEDQK